MRECGVKVLTVRDILSYGADEHIGARVELEDLAMKSLTYDLANGYKCAPALLLLTLPHFHGLCGAMGQPASRFRCAGCWFRPTSEYRWTTRRCLRTIHSHCKGDTLRCSGCPRLARGRILGHTHLALVACFQQGRCAVPCGGAPAQGGGPGR